MEVNYSFDHAMVLVNDVSLAATDYAALGFTVAKGGQVGNGWLQNAGVLFPDGSYVELLGFRRRWVLPALRILKRAGLLRLILPRRSWIERRFLSKAAARKGLMDFAVLSGSIEDDVELARRRGLGLESPLPFSLVRPDGQDISWLQASPYALDVPFIVEYVTQRSGGEHHPNGAEGVAGVTVAVTDLDASAARYRQLLGVDPSEGAVSPLPEARTVDFVLGSATITLATPAGKSTSLRGHLARQGEGPYFLKLRTSRSISAGTLDPTRTHGARLELVAV